MGGTCTFTESGTTVSRFCENGCCDNQCCSDTSVDKRAVAIAFAVILAVLLLIALIILLIYCWWKRTKRGKNKTDIRHTDTALTEMQPNKNKNLRNGYPASFFGPIVKVNRLIQTGDPEVEPKDKILWGRINRWSSNPTSKSGPPRRTWNRAVNPMDNFSQTSDDDMFRYKQIPPGSKIGTTSQTDSLPPSPFHSDIIEFHEKGIQTPATKMNNNDYSKVAKDQNKLYLASWTPRAPWRPSAQHKSLTHVNQPRQNASNNPKEIEPFYTVHRCPPDSSVPSEQSGFHNRSHDLDISS